MTALDETHDPQRKSWVVSAAGHLNFPIQNLPLGIFSLPNGELSGGVAIGDAILDLRAAAGAGLFSGAARLAADAASGPTLNPMMALGQEPRIALRKRLSELLSADPETTSVTEIAHNHQFVELGRFAVAYRAVFGEMPSFTLRRSTIKTG